MHSKLDRREFIKTGTLLGAGVIFGRILPGLYSDSSDLFAMDIPEISVIQGDDYFANTIKAVDALGSMKNFVKKNSTVGLLINSRYNKPGTFVKPEIALAVLNMCFSSGAKEIISLENVSNSYWRLSSFSKKYSEIINRIKPAGGNYIKVKIPKGISLKEAEIEKSLLDCDVFINIPIFKQHEGVQATGCLKNLMGLTSSETNKYFHFGSKANDWYADVNFLSQCIADINLIRKPDLCIADATEYITTNGPFGPGNVVKTKKILAGKDPVALDSYGARLLGHNPEDIPPIKMAFKHGLGQIDLSKVKIQEIKV
ncbi:MAG: DUF362 domain-containing protein [Bacillota bacterium]